MTFPAPIRRQILERSRGCEWPLCSDPFGEHPPVGYKRGVEADHIVATRDGGPDTVENGRTLCAYHHELVSNAQKARWAKEPKVGVNRLLVLTAGDLVGAQLGSKGGIVRRAEPTASAVAAGPRSALSGRKAGPGQAGISPRRHYTWEQAQAAAARRAPENFDDQGGFWGA